MLQGGTRTLILAAALGGLTTSLAQAELSACTPHGEYVAAAAIDTEREGHMTVVADTDYCYPVRSSSTIGCSPRYIPSTCGRATEMIGSADQLTGSLVTVPLAQSSEVVGRPPTTTPLTVSVGPMTVVATTAAKPYGWPDGTMGVERLADGSYRFTGAHTTEFRRCAGTLAVPVSGGCEPEKSASGVPPEFRYASGGPIYKDPERGVLIQFQHLERWDGDNFTRFYASGGLAKSSDDGATWQWLGEIIRYPVDFSSPAAYFALFPPMAGEAIGSLPYIIKDGYFYVYHGDHLADGTHVRLTVSRARVADVVRWANGGEAVSFMKYHAGAFTEAGLGGTSSALVSDSTIIGSPAVVYNALLERYVMIGIGGGWPRPPVVWLESTDGLVWTNYHTIVARDNASRAYMTLAGPGNDPTVTGSEFYLYYIRSVAEGSRAGKRNSDAQLVRHLITVSAP